LGLPEGGLLGLFGPIVSEYEEESPRALLFSRPGQPSGESGSELTRASLCTYTFTEATCRPDWMGSR